MPDCQFFFFEGVRRFLAVALLNPRLLTPYSWKARLVVLTISSTRCNVATQTRLDLLATGLPALHVRLVSLDGDDEFNVVQPNAE